MQAHHRAGRDELSAECIGVSVVGYLCFLLRRMSIEKCLGTNLTSSMVLSKGSSKAEMKG